MSMQNRRSTFFSSTTLFSTKRQSTSLENVSKFTAVLPHLAKKRTPLRNITNEPEVPCSNKVTKADVCKVTSLPRSEETVLMTSSTGITSKVPSLPRNDEIVVPSIVSPTKSDGSSVSKDETVSTCNSLKSSHVEYMDNNDVPALDSTDKNGFRNLYIPDHEETTRIGCTRDILVDKEMHDEFVNLDDNYMDPQLCATFACDIYEHLRASEALKRPLTDFMERIQKDIDSSKRAILIDWLVEVAEEFRFLPDTLYLTVNYIDRYLSGNVVNSQHLQLLGVACMLIAAKYEEICAPPVEEFCYITDNAYFKQEVIEMESAVLNYLKFEMTAPTAQCFLRRFVRAAQRIDEAPPMQLECLANYILELSLLEYSMLHYAPSLIAASAIFLAKYMLLSSKRPWSSTLQHYTLYQPSDLIECVKDLHSLCCKSNRSMLPGIRKKYSQHKYKYVAKKFCPPSIPPEYFRSY